MFSMVTSCWLPLCLCVVAIVGARVCLGFDVVVAFLVYELPVLSLATVLVRVGVMEDEV